MGGFRIHSTRFASPARGLVFAEGGTVLVRMHRLLKVDLD